ncbi:MAG: DUF1697 domain-containing protein [Actinomycetota bacterium]
MRLLSLDMTKYGAFLRGINLARQRRISSAGLKSVFEDMEFEDVSTFRTSGNVIFAADRAPLASLTARIEKALAKFAGFEVVVFLRTESEVRTIARHRPFPRKLADSMGKLQVLMLSSKPTAAKQKKVLGLATDRDRLAFGVRELYWLPTAGTQGSALDLAAIEKLLGSTTMRTKGTIEQLAAKYFDD